MNTHFSRRSFLRSTASLATLIAVPRPLFGDTTPAKVNGPESMVKLLFESLKPAQRKEVCFDWDFIDPMRGLLRTRVENNWRITKPSIRGDFYTADQQAMIRSIFEGRDGGRAGPPACG